MAFPVVDVIVVVVVVLVVSWLSTQMREDDGSRLAVLRCVVTRGHVTGAERQRAYAMGDLQTRHVSGCHVPRRSYFPPGDLKILWDVIVFGSA